MNVAFIPVRGGSKSIPLKNIKEIAGKPLVYWTVKAACECDSIDKVYVATDSERIEEVVKNFCEMEDKFSKVQVIGRSKESASDTATTESAMLEFAEEHEFDNIVLVQATSPLLTNVDLDRGFETFGQEGTDSVLSVVRQKRFQWKNDENGFAYPTNYDVSNRPRRQELEGYLVENGAFYITSKKMLLESKNRISGNIRACEMDEFTYFEIDEPSDWIIIENQLKSRNRTLTKEIPEIRMFLTDCDGCLTDGGMYYSENGDELKKFNTLDGMGLQLLRKKGIVTGIITGEICQLNYRRAQKLKVDIFKEGIQDKLSVVRTLCEQMDIDIHNVAYVGDDINDLDVIKTVGFGCSVKNGIQKVKEAAVYVTKATGGQGAVREVVDLILDQTI